MKYFCVFVFTFFSFSCKFYEKEGVKNVVYSDPTLVDEGLNEWVQVQNSIELELPDSLTIGKVVQIEFTDSEILVLEDGVNSSIMIFDRSGEFKNQLLKQGTGPDEYTQIEFFVLVQNQIIVYDRNLQKLISYQNSDFDEFQEYKTQDYFVGGVGSLGSNRFFMISDSELDGNIYQGYQFYDSDFSNPKFFPQSAGFIEAFQSASISKFEEKTLFVQPFTEKVFRVEKDTMIIDFEIDYGSKMISSEVVSLTEAEEFWEELGKGHYYFATSNFLKKGDAVSFNFFNQSIENINFGLIEEGNAYRFELSSDIAELFFKPLCVRENVYHSVLLPGEFDEEIGSLLDSKTEIDYEKPILVSYYIAKD